MLALSALPLLGMNAPENLSNKRRWYVLLSLRDARANMLP